ncbi:MAG: aspartate carbamoyltransferase regulatory subunit [Chlamydiota bacterium]
MYTESKTLPISAIKNGVVIDHVNVGQALTIISILKLSSPEQPITLGLNLPSASMGSKDLIKLEEYRLTDEECDKIAVLSPNVSVNIIQDFEIIEKMKLELPDKIAAIAPCPNSRCITNHEKVESLFVINKRGPLAIQLRCHYCRKEMTQRCLSK